MPHFFLLLIVAVASLTFTSCETTNSAANHKPNFDYWQNGGGACCPQHAAEFARKR